MVSYVDPASLKDEPLRLKRVADDSYMVMVRDLPAGRIMATVMSGGVAVWIWTITGPFTPTDMAASGREDSLDKARLAFKNQFEAWQAWAEKLGHHVIWTV